MRKGIILAGGAGTRLDPITRGVSKQLLPIYDKPMIYYPICTLMLSGIKEILLITNPSERESFKRLIQDGSQWGINVQYKVQEAPDGIAQALLLGADFLDNSPVALILGDNLFHGHDLISQLKNACLREEGATIFAYPVSDPERYGVVTFDKNGTALSLEEKPSKPKSRYAITGIYFYDSTATDKANQISPSKRGELEITDINKLYLNDSKLNVEILGRGMAWLDTGTFDSLNEASNYIRTLENRQGFKVSCPEEIAWRQGWITDEQLEITARKMVKSGYGGYLLSLLEDKSALISNLTALNRM